MEYLQIVDLTLFEFTFFCGIILLASFVRGFSGFGFFCIKCFFVIFHFTSKRNSSDNFVIRNSSKFFYDTQYLEKKINWRFVLFLLLGVSVGTPIGINLLAYLEPRITHFIISITVLVFAFLLLKGYKNTNLNHNLSKFFVGGIAGTVNGFGTLAGLPIALYLLIIAAEPAVIRTSLAALFFFLICML